MALLVAGVAHGVTNFECTIDGAQNVPPNPVSATGTGSFVLNDAQTELTYTIEFSGLTSPEIAAHLHNAGFHSNGPVVHGLPLGSPKAGVWSITPSQVTELFAGRIYVNIHSEIYTLGEIRGNLTPVATGVDSEPPKRSSALKANVPNPFKPTTTIEYSIAEPAHVSLRIFDTSGRLVRTLVNWTQSPDKIGAAVWDGTDDRGRLAPTGVYFYQLRTAGFEQTRKMLLLR
jgi:hypothetical protein